MDGIVECTLIVLLRPGKGFATGDADDLLEWIKEKVESTFKREGDFVKEWEEPSRTTCDLETRREFLGGWKLHCLSKGRIVFGHEIGLDDVSGESMDRSRGDEHMGFASAEEATAYLEHLKQDGVLCSAGDMIPGQAVTPRGAAVVVLPSRRVESSLS
jgi:hypothetical protein